MPTLNHPTPLAVRLYDRFAPERLKVLKASGKRWHRYRAFRMLTMAGTLGMLFLVPLVGLARFDLFGGDHRALGAPVSTFHGLIAVGVSIFAFYFLTFQVNLVAGRMFCGWGCPVGQLNRLADSLRSAKSLRQRLLWGSALTAFATALGAALLLWWSAPTVLLSFPYNIMALAAVAGIAGGGIFFARFVGWSFCKQACPIGLYYSVVQQKRPIGILFDQANCLEEEACVKVCPVNLDPRDMLALRSDIGGLAIDGLTSQSHCLRCGECVEACDLVTSKVGPVALSFGRPPEPILQTTPDALVQLPSRSAAPINDTLLPAQAEPEGPGLSFAELALTGGPDGLFGSGLSLLGLVAAALISNGVLLLLPLPLWSSAPGTPVWPRFLASALTTPVLAAVLLVVQRRLRLMKWIEATGLILTLLLVLGSTAYAVLAPGSGNRYRPTQTWTANHQETNKAQGYRPAGAGFAEGTIDGKAVGPEGPVAGALVYLEHVGDGAPLAAKREILVTIDAGHWNEPIYAVATHDELRLANPTAELHTLHLSHDNRTVRNLPLTPGLENKRLSPPAAGRYELTCDNHKSEKGRLFVFDHPYFAFTDADGSFRLPHVPVGRIELRVAAPAGHGHSEMELTAGQTEIREIRIEP